MQTATFAAFVATFVVVVHKSHWHAASGKSILALPTGYFGPLPPAYAPNYFRWRETPRFALALSPSFLRVYSFALPLPWIAVEALDHNNEEVKK